MMWHVEVCSDGPDLFQHALEIAAEDGFDICVRVFTADQTFR
jgi:hypothetical protein